MVERRAGGDAAVTVATIAALSAVIVALIQSGTFKAWIGGGVIAPTESASTSADKLAKQSGLNGSASLTPAPPKSPEDVAGVTPQSVRSTPDKRDTPRPAITTVPLAERNKVERISNIINNLGDNLPDSIPYDIYSDNNGRGEIQYKSIRYNGKKGIAYVYYSYNSYPGRDGTRWTPIPASFIKNGRRLIVASFKTWLCTNNRDVANLIDNGIPFYVEYDDNLGFEGGQFETKITCD